MIRKCNALGARACPQPSHYGGLARGCSSYGTICGFSELSSLDNAYPTALACPGVAGAEGHHMLAIWWLGWDQPPQIVNLVLRIGVVVALAGYVLNTRWQILWKLLVMRAIPTIGIMLLVGSHLDDFFQQSAFVASMLILTGVTFLFVRQPEPPRDMNNLNMADGLLLGAAGTLSIVHGLSGIASMLLVGMWRGFGRLDALRLSLTFSLPIWMVLLFASYCFVLGGLSLAIELFLR